MTETPQKRRTSFNLGPDAENAVREIARKRGLSMGEVISRAIGTEKFLMEAREKGSKVLLQDSDKTFREVIAL